MEHGLGEIGRRDGCLPNRNLDLALASGSPRFDPRLAAAKEDEQTPLGPCILYSDSHQLLDELGKDHLTRNRLRRFHYSFDIQLPHRRGNRGRRGGSSLLAQARIAFVELPYLAMGAPTVVAVPRGTEIGVTGCFQIARQVESSRKLVGYGLVVNQARGACRTDRTFVQPLCVEFPPLDPRHLRPGEGRPVGKILRAMESPGVQLLQMCRQPRTMIFAVLTRGGFMDCRVAKSVVEMVLDDLQKRHSIPEHRLRPGGRLQGVHVFTREETRLQLADVVPAFRKRQRRVAGQITLQIAFMEHGIVEGAEPGGQSPQAADETKLAQNPALDRSETDLAGKGEPVFGLLLRLDQRVAGHEIVGVELAAGVSRVTDFTGPAGEVEAAKQELAGLSDMLRPRHDETECLECPGLKTLQSRPLDQLAPQPSKAVAGIELAEVGPCQGAQLHVGNTRCIAVTPLESQADSRANRHLE